MTKTITLVSSIARTDFNLLDSNELAALTDQLEHLLLVDLSEEEMPEKTRLSFAAIRLTWLAERRLANTDKLASLRLQQDSINKRLRDAEVYKNVKIQLKNELRKINEDINKENDHIKNEVDNAFQLLRKVLRERPDRVRLWTRAVLMCRLTGIKGLKVLREDIKQIREKDNNPLAAEYLLANLLTLLGSQALIAGRILEDENTAYWRKEAARKFLYDLCENYIPEQKNNTAHDFLRVSWHIYWFGIYCASLLIRDKVLLRRLRFVTKPPTKGGLQYLVKKAGIDTSSSWAWWAARKTFIELSPHADELILNIGNQIKGLPNTIAFWRFFPLDISSKLIPIIAVSEPSIPEGWWYDCLNHQQKNGNLSHVDRIQKKTLFKRALRLLDFHMNSSTTKSLYDWCRFVNERAYNLEGDPRFGEWTALEIVKQIAGLVKRSKEVSSLTSYLNTGRPSSIKTLNLHPANFAIPIKWMNENNHLTWEEWKKIVEEKRIKWVREKYRIQDPRYTPIKIGNSLFTEVNPVRGLGLLLYGLLSRCFDYPTVWNGPGHSDLLRFLPKLLLNNVTCSSWTLGILQGCLLPRSTENIYLRQLQQPSVDDDTVRDPIRFINVYQVEQALQKCQKILDDYQLSTFNHKARQLTPVSIKQLTQPDWTNDFPFDDTGEH